VENTSAGCLVGRRFKMFNGNTAVIIIIIVLLWLF